MEYFIKYCLVAILVLRGINVLEALGRGKSRPSIVNSFILCIICFFYIFTFGSFINANIFVLQNGITYDTFFEIFVINKYIDHIFIAICLVLWIWLCIASRLKPIILISIGSLIVIGITLNSNLSATIFEYIALLSIPTIIGISLYHKFSSNKSMANSPDLLPQYLAIFTMVIGVITSILVIGHIFSIHESPIRMKDYAYDIFVLFSSSSAIMMILLIFCFPLKVLFNSIITKLMFYREARNSMFLDAGVTRRSKLVSISLIILLSIVLAIIPHLPAVNHNHQLVGSDTSAYVGWQNELERSKNSGDFLFKAFHNFGDRSITLMLVFGLVKSLQLDSSTVIDNLPIILGPTLVVVVYLLTREILINEKVSLLASFFTAVSFQTLIGIYAGYYSNWIALIIGYLSFVFLFKFLKKEDKTNIILFSILMILLLFSHEYTWTVLAMVAGIFLTVMVVTNRYRRRNTLLLLAVILSTVLIDVAKNDFIGVSNGFERDLSVAHQEQVGISQFANRWYNLKDTMQNYYASLFSNFIILGLALYWVLRCNLHEIPSIFFLIFFSVGILPLFFGDWVVQSRVFYDIPFQIPAALALGYIRKEDNRIIITLPICIWLISISLRSVYNFPFPS